MTGTECWKDRNNLNVQQGGNAEGILQLGGQICALSIKKEKNNKGGGTRKRTKGGTHAASPAGNLPGGKWATGGKMRLRRGEVEEVSPQVARRGGTEGV